MTRIFCKLFALLLAIFASISSTTYSAATTDVASAQKQLQKMAAGQHSALSNAKIAELKNILSQSALLDSPRLEPATINALGKLLFLASADREFVNRDARENVLDQLSRRIGIDVDARGYVNLIDRISVLLGKEPTYGSIGGKIGSSLTAEQVRTISGARRFIGLTSVHGDKSNALPFPDQPLPLAMLHPVYPTLPDVRAELLELMVLDQDVRQPLPSDASKVDRLARRKHMQEVDARVQASFLPIFEKYGFPTNAMVGHYGTLAAWVLIQHAIQQPELMQQAVQQAKILQARGELPEGPYSLLVDRVACLIAHKPQTYGTFPVSDPKDPYYCPIEDPSEVNKRRAAIFLEPIDIGGSKQ